MNPLACGSVGHADRTAGSGAHAKGLADLKRSAGGGGGDNVDASTSGTGGGARAKGPRESARVHEHSNHGFDSDSGSDGEARGAGMERHTSERCVTLFHVSQYIFSNPRVHQKIQCFLLLTFDC
jgi:hypothetical protein